MSSLLRAEQIHTHYGESHILHDINMEIKPGEAVGLLGRNGMGKSTLIRTMLGHVKASSGKVYVREQDRTSVEPFKIARLGVAYVPEGRGIFPNLSVKENLLVSAGSGFSNQDAWDYDRVLDTFPRLSERLTHGGQQLSGGEQQMLAIGRALSTNPRLLILDEATEGLAPVIRDEIWACLAKLRQEGQTTLIVDKYLEKLLSLADRHVILERGRVVWQGSSASLADNRSLWSRYLGV